MKANVEEKRPLTEEEAKDVRTLVKERIEKDLQKGHNAKEYLISEILDDYWDAVKTDGGYPKRFKRSAQRGDISHLVWVRTKTDNNELYRIDAP